MPTLPRPKLFQIHLSTAVVLMFVAGALMGLNLTKHLLSSKTNESFFTPIASKCIHFKELCEVSTYGWPSAVLTLTQTSALDENDKVTSTRCSKEWRNGSITTNSAIALGILFAIWFLCEWLIRRRAARKEA